MTPFDIFLLIAGTIGCILIAYLIVAALWWWLLGNSRWLA